MSELEEVAGWKMSELENDEVGKCRSWLLSGWQASELDFDAFPIVTASWHMHETLIYYKIKH